MNASMTTSGVPDPADEVVVLLSDLIRINTSNPTHPERPAAEWAAERLAEVDIDARIFESEPGRASVVARVPGSDPTRSPLLIHGHLDVVPADAAEWTVHPFSGEVRDGYVWANDKPGWGVDIDETAAARYPIEVKPIEWTQSRWPDGTLWTP